MKLEIYITSQVYKRGPNIKIISKKSAQDFTNFTANKIVCEIESAPTQFTIMHYGKTDQDMLIENDQIVKDVGFTLNSIKINGHVLTNEIFRFDTCFMDGTKIQANNYFGYNCFMTIDINKPLDFWIFDLKNKKSTTTSHEIDIDKFIQEILS